MTDQIIGKVLAEKYRIDSLLKADESGNLYHGTHLLMEKPVAVKILPTAVADEANVKSFAGEARTVSRLSHPAILNITDYGTDKENGPFIVYEDITGETLKEAINRNGKFSLPKANRIVKEIASVLSAAHAGGVVHQNLSSQNILLQPPAVKVTGFGTRTFDLNDLDYPIEKIEYLAPEQCALGGKIDRRTDVYALGVILFEMLTGQVPLTAQNGTDLLEKQGQEPPPPLNAFRRDLPDEVDDILLKALAKNPEIRYQNVDEFAADLNQASLLVSDTGEEETVVAARPAVPANAVARPEPPQNNLWKTAFIVLAGISLLGATFIYLTNAGKQTNPSTQMQMDANGMPVQPAPPPTGSMEQTLSNMDSFNPNYGNTNSVPTDTGGGVSNPYWESGGRPPGAPPVTGYGDPYPVMPGNTGPTVYVGPPDANRSIFMQDGNEYILVPKGNTNTASNVNTQPKRNTNTNTATGPANTTVKPTPAANTSTPQVRPTPAQTPKPAETKPKTEPTKPPTTEKRPVSGKQQDTD